MAMHPTEPVPPRRPTTLQESVRSLLVELRDPPGRPGVPTGFGDLDALTGGLTAGLMWVITGRSGAGKSVLATDLVRSAAVRRGLPTLMVGRGEGTTQATCRLLAAQARVPLHHLTVSRLDLDDWTRLDAVSASFNEAPVWMLAMDQVDPAELYDVVVELGERDRRVGLMVVDDVPVGDEQVGVLRSLTGLAVEHDLCVVAVAQPEVQLPQQQTLGFEQFADVVLNVHRDDQDDQRSPRAGEADFIVSRHRHGPVATVTVAFQGFYGRFVDLTS